MSLLRLWRSLGRRLAAAADAARARRGGLASSGCSSSSKS